MRVDSGAVPEGLVPGRPEDPPCVVAVPVVAAVGAEKDIPAALSVPGGAAAPLLCALACLDGQQPGEEGRDVDRRQRLHVRAAVRVVLRREPTEAAADLPELPLDVVQARERDQRRSCRGRVAEDSLRWL